MLLTDVILQVSRSSCVPFPQNLENELVYVPFFQDSALALDSSAACSLYSKANRYKYLSSTPQIMTYFYGPPSNFFSLFLSFLNIY